MIDLLLNEDGDIKIENGKLSLTGKVAQKVVITLKTFLGEWFLDDEETVGIPYFQSILGKKISKEKLDQIFKNKILEIEEVLKIDSLSISTTEGKVKINVKFTSKNNTKEKVGIDL